MTGIVVAPGNVLMARIYDKTTELGLSGREHKREIEHACLRAGGWDGIASVTRVEFQHRGRYLDQVGLRNPRDLPAQVDPVWQRDVIWARLIRPDTASRLKRCKLDARWEAVTSTVFRHQSAPIERWQLRGDGAQPSHVRGAVQSLLGANGALDWLAVAEDGEVLDENEYADLLSVSQQERWVRRHYARVCARAGVLIAKRELAKHGPRNAVVRAIAQNNATVARYSSCAEIDPSWRRSR